MHFSLVVAVIAALAVGAMAGSSSYGPPQRDYQPPADAPAYGPPAYTPQVFKHVYVHTAPDEPADQQNRVIRVPGGDKHVNIIFVKTPSSSSSSQTEVILPDQDEQKNLVYVLLKKAENSNDIKIRRPQAQRPQKPEVYFIRYKGQEEGGYGQAPPPPPPQQGGYQQAPPSAPLPVRVPSSSYGSPF